ncbi:hypothetical protein CPC08DRAFT_764524 [Agrocybe pediades]|nr:hypothetical protein CPC08DRAFT_764524 [Agrocybe pediades]
MPTNVYVNDAKKIILSYATIFIAASLRTGHRLDILLANMMRYAPHILGKRYAAITIILAADHGPAKLLAVAEGWFHRLYKPMAQKRDTSSGGIQPSPSPLTPLLGATTNAVGLVKSRDGGSFREKVLNRDGKCMISGRKDFRIGIEEIRALNAAPQIYGKLEAAHIIPFSLNSDRQAKGQAAQTWSMLRAWSGNELQVTRLAGKNINSIRNGMLLEVHMHAVFDEFLIYFEQIPDSNRKYIVKLTIPGLNVFHDLITDSMEVTFSGEDADIPDPLYLKIHASVAKCIMPALYIDNFSDAEWWIKTVEDVAEETDRMIED